MLKKIIGTLSLATQQLIHWWQIGFGIRPFSLSSKALTDWASLGAGKRLFDAEESLLNELTAQCFGYHSVYMSPSTTLPELPDLRVSYQFKLHPEACPAGQVVGNFESLPLPQEAMDLVILHHALDYSLNPHAILRETERVLVARGYVAIVGFNPLSLWGAYCYIARFFSKNPLYRTSRLRLGRTLDWLKLLNLSPVQIAFASFLQPRRVVSLDTQLQYPYLNCKTPWRLPWGGVYVILARKDCTAMIPIKPTWTFTAQPNHWAISRESLKRTAMRKDD